MTKNPKAARTVKSTTERGEINTPVRLHAVLHDVDDGSYLVEYRFRTIDGRDASLVVSRATTNPKDVYDAMMKLGAKLPARGEALQLVAHVMTTTPGSTIRVTKRPGWHDDSFVHADWTEGSQDGPRLLRPQMSDGSSCESLSSRGEPEKWRSLLRQPCRGSSILSFAIGIAFAAPLMRLLGEDEGVVFNFHGRSSAGKTLAARACQSVFDLAAKNELVTYGSTRRGIEEAAVRRCDLVVVIDEEGLASGSSRSASAQKRELAFLIPGGAGDRRSDAVASNLPNLTWRAFGITTGEVPLEDAGGRARAGGERLRHIDIPVLKHPAGIFDRLERTDPKKTGQKGGLLARKVERAIADHHGTALRPYIRVLLSNNGIVERTRSIVEAFVAEVGADSDGWEARFARKFGMVKAGMLIAAEHGIAPWDAETVDSTVKRIYRRARRAVHTTDELAADILSKVQDWWNGVRLPSVNKGGGLPKGKYGFCRRHPKHGPIVAVDPARIRRLIPSRSAREAALNHLIQTGRVVRGSDGKGTLQLEIESARAGKRPRWICFRASALTSQVFEKVGARTALRMTSRPS